MIYSFILAVLAFCQAGLSASDDDPVKEIQDAPAPKKYQLDVAIGAGKHFGQNRLIVSNINRRLEACRTVSEIRFPANPFMIYARAGLNIRDKYFVQLKVNKSVGPLYGTCEDTDWQPISKHRGMMWSYSTSAPHLVNGVMPDVSVLFKTYKRDGYVLKLGAGFLYEHYNYRTGDLRQMQVDPFFRSSRLYCGFQFNKVMTYNLNFFNLYVEMINEISFVNKSLVIEFGFKWAPYAISYDIDNHILRAIKFYGNSYYGTTILPLVRVTYIHKNRYFWTLEFNYQYTRTWCIMKSQYYYNSIYSTQIVYDMYMNYLFSGSLSSYGPQILESSQCTLQLGMGMRFEF